MGRTLETYRIRLEKEKTLWNQRLRLLSSRRVQVLFESTFKRAHWYSDAMTFWANGLIQEKILFSILFSQYRQILDFQNRKSLFFEKEKIN